MSTRGGRGADLRTPGARPDRHVEGPRSRLGLGRPRRVEVDLDLLLVRAAGTERNQVHRRRHDTPPALGQSHDADVVVVDDVALIAHVRQQHRAPARLDGELHRLQRIGQLVARQPQRQRDGCGRDRRRAGGRSIGRRRCGRRPTGRRRCAGRSGASGWGAAGGAADAAGSTLVASQRRYSPQTQKSWSSAFWRPQLGQVRTGCYSSSSAGIM